MRQKHDNGEQAQPQGRALSARTHALAQQAGIERQKRGHDDGGQDREVEPEAEDRNGAGGGKQRHRCQNEEDGRLFVSRNWHGPSRCEHVPAPPGRRGTKDVAPTFKGKPARLWSLGGRTFLSSASNPG